MDVKVKLTSKSKNVVRFSAIADTEDAGKSLRPSGAPNYGQAEFVVPDEGELNNFKEGDEYILSISPAESSPEEDTEG